MKEGDIKKQIMAYLATLPGCFAKVVQIGGIKGRTNTAKGMSDIVAIYKGRFLAIEVKTKTGVLAPHQREFLDKIQKCGGIAFVATSVQEVIDKLEPTRNKEEKRDYLTTSSFGGCDVPLP